MRLKLKERQSLVRVNAARYQAPSKRQKGITAAMRRFCCADTADV